MNLEELNKLKANVSKLEEAIKGGKSKLAAWASDPQLHNAEMQAAQAEIVLLQEKLKQARIDVLQAEIELL